MKNDILKWWRTTYKDGSFTVEERYSPMKGSLVIKSQAFLTFQDAWDNVDRSPITKGFKACYFCEYYHRSDRFCAVNPYQVEKGTNCLDKTTRN